MTTIYFPCPGCATELSFTRGDKRDAPVTATCDRCGLRYVMTPDGVHRIDDRAAKDR